MTPERAPSVGFADISPANGGEPSPAARRVLPRETGEGDHAKHGGGGLSPHHQARSSPVKRGRGTMRSMVEGAP